jgi:hypothetical protein
MIYQTQTDLNPQLTDMSHIIETSLPSCIINSFKAHTYISVAKHEGKKRPLREA